MEIAAFDPIKFFIDGKWAMWPLLVCSIVAVAFIIERGLALRRAKVISDALAREIDEMKPGEETEVLAEKARHDDSMLGRLATIAFRHAQYSKEENTEAIQARGRHEATMLERGLVIIEIAAYVAPLLGLLGTVSGMASIFAEIGFQNVAQQQTKFAAGISEILNATITGLIIAIPSYIAYSYYSRKIEMMVVEVETICADLVAKLYRES